MSAYDDLLVDFADEAEALLGVVADLDDDGLLTPTPADGWTIRDQIGHLAGFDEAARTAAVEPDVFAADLERRIAEGADPIAEYTAIGRSMTPLDVVAWWRRSNAELRDALRPLDPKTRVPWYGPPMSAMSHATARTMETWAHGQDVRDALGVAPSVSRRLRHVAHLGVAARPFAYAVHGLDVPDVPVDVVLAAPDGSSWTWGPGDAVDRVEGPALDFCLLVTQRRHRDDVALAVMGAAADEWMGIAQAFAGAAGSGRDAGQFS